MDTPRGLERLLENVITRAYSNRAVWEGGKDGVGMGEEKRSNPPPEEPTIDTCWVVRRGSIRGLLTLGEGGGDTHAMSPSHDSNHHTSPERDEMR